MPKRPFVEKRPALERFLEKCRFDPATGCVLWIGGTTAGRGHHARYGSFKYQRKRWFAHRWAAKFIHGLEIDDMQVDHCCPHTNTPNTLCVQHLQAVLPSINRELQWIRVQVGCDEYPYPELEDSDDIPFHVPPPWLTSTAIALADCPF